jgi:hypothetical protein
MDTWDSFLAEEKHRDQILSIINSPNLVLFFTKDDLVFAAPEDSRVVFARLKSKGDEDGEKWKNDADFMAINLTSLVSDGKVSQSVMGKKDLRKIKVIDREEVERLLMKQSKSKKASKVISIVVPNNERKK